MDRHPDGWMDEMGVGEMNDFFGLSLDQLNLSMSRSV